MQFAETSLYKSHYEETVYFLSEIPGTHQINIGKTKG